MNFGIVILKIRQILGLGSARMTAAVVLVAFSVIG